MQTAIMTIFQVTPEEVVEIRVGVGGEEVMRRSERISGDEGCVCCEMRVVVVFRVIVIWEYQERHVNLTINIRKIKHE